MRAPSLSFISVLFGFTAVQTSDRNSLLFPVGIEPSRLVPYPITGPGLCGVRPDAVCGCDPISPGRFERAPFVGRAEAADAAEVSLGEARTRAVDGGPVSCI
jgi:hypothetical protein